MQKNNDSPKDFPLVREDLQHAAPMDPTPFHPTPRPLDAGPELSPLEVPQDGSGPECDKPADGRVRPMLERLKNPWGCAFWDKPWVLPLVRHVILPILLIGAALSHVDVLAICYLFSFLAHRLIPPVRHHPIIFPAVILSLAAFGTVWQFVAQVLLHLDLMSDFYEAHPAGMEDLMIRPYRSFLVAFQMLGPHPFLIFCTWICLAKPSPPQTEDPTVNTGKTPQSRIVATLIFLCAVFSAVIAFTSPSFLPLGFILISGTHSILLGLRITPSKTALLMAIAGCEWYTAAVMAPNFIFQLRSLAGSSWAAYVLGSSGVQFWSPFYWMQSLLLILLFLLQVLTRYLTIGRFFLHFPVLSLAGPVRRLLQRLRLRELTARCAWLFGPLMVMVFFAAGFTRPSVPSSLWVAMFCVGIMAPYAIFLRILPYALGVSWALLVAQVIVSIWAIHVPPDVMKLLGIVNPSFPFPSLLFSYTIPLLASAYLNAIHEFSQTCPRRFTVLTPIVQPLISLVQRPPPPDASKMRRHLHKVSILLVDGLLKQSKNLALLFVFAVGLSDVTVLNTIFVLLFGLLLIWTAYARRLWRILVYYTFVCALSRYFYVMVYLAASKGPWTDQKWTGFSGDMTTGAILVYFLLLLAVVVQREIYRLGHTWHRPQMTVPYLRMQNSLTRIACLMCFAYFSLRSPVNIICFIYLLLLIIMLPITSTTVKRLSITRFTWYFVATYTLVVVLAQYTYQFAPIQEHLNAALDKVNLSPQITGLEQYRSLFIGLLPWSIVFGLTVYKSWLIIVLHTKHGDDKGADPTGQSQQTPLQDDFQEPEELDLELHAMAAEALSWIRRFCIVLLPRSTLCALFVASVCSIPRDLAPGCGSTGAVQPVRTSLSALGYVILLLVLNVRTKTGPVMRTLLCLHPALVMVAVYLYQFPFVSQGLHFCSPATWRYIGLPSAAEDNVRVAQLLWPHLLVFLHGICLHNTARWQQKMHLQATYAPSFDPSVNWTNVLRDSGSPQPPAPEDRQSDVSNPLELPSSKNRVSFANLSVELQESELGMVDDDRSHSSDNAVDTGDLVIQMQDQDGGGGHMSNGLQLRRNRLRTQSAPVLHGAHPPVLSYSKSVPIQSKMVDLGEELPPPQPPPEHITLPPVDPPHTNVVSGGVQHSGLSPKNSSTLSAEDVVSYVHRSHSSHIPGYAYDWQSPVLPQYNSGPLKSAPPVGMFMSPTGSSHDSAEDAPSIEICSADGSPTSTLPLPRPHRESVEPTKSRGWAHRCRPALSFILKLTQFVVNEAPVRYPYTLLVFLLLLSAGLRLDNVWALSEVLCVGVLIGIGRWRMTRVAWTVLLVIVSFLYLCQFCILLGAPPALAFKLPLQPNVAYACEFWGPQWYAFLQLQLGLQDIACSFGILFLTGVARIVTARKKKSHWQPSPSLTTRLSKVWRDVALVRKKVTAASAMEALRAFLPPPPHARDFTCAHKRLSDFVSYTAFTIPLYIGLGLLFITGAARRPPLSLLDLLHILLALSLYHIFGEVKWKGNRLWIYVLGFQYLHLLLQVLVCIPPLHTASQSSKVLQFLGIQSHPTPGVIPLTLAFLFLQSLNFDDPRYVFLLYEAHRKVIRGLQRAELHATLWRLEQSRYRANAIEQKALRRQRLLSIRRHREQREQQLRQRLEEAGSGFELGISLSRCQSFAAFRPVTASEDFDTPASPCYTTPSRRFSLNTIKVYLKDAVGSNVKRCWQRFIIFVEHHSVAYRFRKYEARAVAGKVPIPTILKQFFFSYTEWYVYAAFTYAFVFTPSLSNVALPVSMFAYAMLSTPRRIYWQIVLLYVETLILLKSMAVTFRPSAELELEPAQVDLASIYRNFFPRVAFEVIMLGLVSLHHEALRQHGLWFDLRPLAAIDEPPTPEERPASLWGRFATFLRRCLSLDQATGHDLYFYSFFTQLIGFVLVMFSYFSLTGSTSDILSSIRRNLMPGPLVLTCLALFALMCVDRCVYLHKSVPGKAILHFFQLSVFLFCWQLYLLRPAEGRWGVRILFLVHCVYLTLSGRQIKYGYPLLIRNRLTDKFSDPRHYTYLAFRSIPFNFELRNLLDWSVTRTSLKFWYWLKLEDIHHELLCTRSDKEDNKYWNRKIGQPYPRRSKILVGACGFLSLSLIIFMPLLFYASFSPALDRNPIDHLSLSVAFSAAPPLYISRTVSPLPLLPSDQANQVAARLQLTHSSLPPRLSNTDNYLQVIPLTEYSQTSFSISPPTRRELLSRLNDTSTPLRVEILATLTRHKGTGTGVSASTVFSVAQSWDIDNGDLRRRFAALLRTKDGGAHVSVPLMDFYSPFLFNSPNGITILSPNTKSGISSESFRYREPHPPSDQTGSSTMTLTYTKSLDDVVMGTGDQGLAKQDCALTMDYEDDMQFFRIKCKSLFSGGNGLSSADFSDEEIRCFNSATPPDITLFHSSCPDYDLAEQNRNHTMVPMYFVVVSEKVTSGVGLGVFFEHFSIITLYTTFIGVLARILRWLLVGKALRIPLEDMPNPSRLITLVEDIKLARSEGDLTLEEELYQELINIYRSDELLRLYTTP